MEKRKWNKVWRDERRKRRCVRNGHFPVRRLFFVLVSLWNLEMHSMLISLTGVCRI